MRGLPAEFQVFMEHLQVLDYHSTYSTTHSLLPQPCKPMLFVPAVCSAVSFGRTDGLFIRLYTD